MLIGRAHSVFQSLTCSIPCRWLVRYGCIVCFVYSACLAGTLDAQQVRSWPVQPGIPKSLQRSAPKTAPAIAAFPLPDTFFLHSRPPANNTKVMYLDFDGHVTTGTDWNSGGNTITTAPYSEDASPTFSPAELLNIQAIWLAVAEYYSPFDIDVTTEQPPLADLMNTGSGDPRWGVRCAIGPTTPDFAGAIGIALLNSFTSDIDTPMFVMPEKTGYDSAFTALVAAHEMGHTLGLDHDGYPANAYYPGHGIGPTSWGPIMGAANTKTILQWSQGEYATANNQEDDLAIITAPHQDKLAPPGVVVIRTNGFGYRLDDHGSSKPAAKPITGTPGINVLSVNQSGVIERSGVSPDTDWFKITAGSGTIILAANADLGTATRPNSMLDIKLDLYAIDGTTLVASSEPTNAQTASINPAVSAGVYYVKVSGVGRIGDGSGNPPDQGYTSYGSLGQYTITGSFSTKGLKGAPVLSMPPGTNGDLFYGVKELPKVINPKIQVADADNPTLPSATVKITPATLKSAEDVLSLKADPQTMGNITSSYDKTTGTLTLTSAGSTATVAQFQAALRAVSYSNSSNNPNNTPRKVEFQVNDGTITSNILTSTVTIGYYYVTASMVGTTLTLADDGGDNSILITLRAGQISVEGAGATRIGTSSSSTQSVTFPYSGDVIIVGNFTGGSDTVSIVSLKSSQTTLNLGDGDDKVYLTYCNIPDLEINGGLGADFVTVVSTVLSPLKQKYTSLTKNGVVFP